MNYSRIKILLEERKITLRELCREVEITEQGFHQMVRNRSMKVEVLERISVFFDVPVSFWFDEATQDHSAPERPVTPFERIDNITGQLNELLKSILKGEKK